MTTPTVGRIVLYFHEACDLPVPAIVQDVGVGDMVALSVFVNSHFEPVRYHSAVQLYQDGAPLPASGDFCTWMPYQIALAKKVALADAPVIPADTQAPDAASPAVPKTAT